MGHHSEAFIGIDTSKTRNAVAIAQDGRGGEVRYLGEFPATDAATRKLVAKLAAKYSCLIFCYEPRMRRARPLPALVIPPRLTLSPVELSEGVRPRYPISSRGF